MSELKWIGTKVKTINKLRRIKTWINALKRKQRIVTTVGARLIIYQLSKLKFHKISKPLKVIFTSISSSITKGRTRVYTKLGMRARGARVARDSILHNHLQRIKRNHNEHDWTIFVAKEKTLGHLPLESSFPPSSSILGHRKTEHQGLLYQSLGSLAIGGKVQKPYGFCSFFFGFMFFPFLYICSDLGSRKGYP